MNLSFSLEIWHWRQQTAMCVRWEEKLFVFRIYEMIHRENECSHKYFFNPISYCRHSYDVNKDAKIFDNCLGERAQMYEKASISCDNIIYGRPEIKCNNLERVEKWANVQFSSVISSALHAIQIRCRSCPEWVAYIRANMSNDLLHSTFSFCCMQDGRI